EALISELAFTYVVSGSFAKSTLLQVAATLDVPDDLTLGNIRASLEHDAASGRTTFTRPNYAGNVISTVGAFSMIFAIHSTAFMAAE
ncbi:hypothetical protein EV702DRAFT_970632, partial [Suillus placidus]